MREVGRIGAANGVSQDLFGQIAAIAVDPLNRVYVADTHRKAIFVFDSAGAFLRSLGREGEGPGEFSWPSGMVWQSDSRLWIVDLMNQRYSVYDTSGVHIGDRTRPALGYLFPWPGRFDDGRLIEASLAGGQYRLVAIDPGAPTSAPLENFPYPLAGVPLDLWNPSYTVESGSIARRIKVPFTEGFEWMLDGRGGVWVGDTREYKLARRTLAGDTVLVIRRDVMSTRVSPQERRAVIDGLGPGGSRVNLSLIPERKPAFRLMIPGDDGGLWVFRESEGSDWLIDVLSSDGQVIASLQLPVVPDLTVIPVIKEHHVWLVTRGELDVPVVVRLAFPPSR